MKMVLQGTLYQKGNSRRLVYNGSSPRVIKSAKALKASADLVTQIKAQWKGKPLEKNITLEADIYYPNNRHDLEASLLCDALQKGGAIKNDNRIKVMILRKHIDKENPRVICEVREGTR